MNISQTAFRATMPAQSNINYNYNSSSNNRIDEELPDYSDLQMPEINTLAKKEKQQERLQKMSAYGTVAIGAGLVGSLLLSIFAMIKSKGKSQAEQDMKKLTEVTLDWIDFKNKSGTVAPLNSPTTSKALREVFNNIINRSKLTKAAKNWGGTKDTGTDIIYLYGHGGTGKTYVAEQFAQEIGAIFTSIKYPDMGSPFKDAASMKISNTFKDIETMANKNKDRPIVVCIDEFDAVIKKVNDANPSDEGNKSRAAVLTGIDALRRKCENITFITTSNYHPMNGQVDEIALRRFNKQIEVPLPDKEQIKGLMEMYMKGVENIGAVIESDFLNTKEAEMFMDKLQKEGYSNGEIELIIQEAADLFKASLKDVPDSELKTKHPFKVEYLEKAMKLKGQAASKTNRLMTVTNQISSGQPYKSNPSSQSSNPEQKLSLWQRIFMAYKILKLK